MSDPARKQFIAGLRALAGFYEARPGAYYDGMRLTVSMYAAGAGGPPALAAMAAAFAEEDLQSEAGATGSHGMDCAGQHALANPGCGGVARAALARDFSAKVRLELFVPGACCGRCA